MPFNTNTDRATNHRDVMLSIQDLLVRELADIVPDDCVVITDDNAPPTQVRDRLFLTIAPDDSQFQEDLQIGGGAQTCFENTGIVVTIFSAMKLDQVGRYPIAVYDEKYGLLEVKRRVLKALIGADPTQNQKTLLSKLVMARGATRPQRDDRGLYFLSVHFDTEFCWDLT